MGNMKSLDLCILVTVWVCAAVYLIWLEKYGIGIFCLGIAVGTQILATISAMRD